MTGSFLQFAPLIFLVVVFGLAFVLPTLRLWLRARTNALVLPGGDSAEAIVGRWFKAVLVLELAATAVWALGPPSLRSIGAIALPWPQAMAVLGWILCLCTLAAVVAAQTHMASSWRIGVDQTPTELRRVGLFALSRNPIFLGMRLMLLGLFLVLPNALTMVAMLLGEAMMQIQVRFEEAHLDRMHGQAYRTYRSQVRRWL